MTIEDFDNLVLDVHNKMAQLNVCLNRFAKSNEKFDRYRAEIWHLANSLGFETINSIYSASDFLKVYPQYSDLLTRFGYPAYQHKLYLDHIRPKDPTDQYMVDERKVLEIFRIFHELPQLLELKESKDMAERWMFEAEDDLDKAREILVNVCIEQSIVISNKGKMVFTAAMGRIVSDTVE